MGRYTCVAKHFSRQDAFSKFFIKKELFWFPILVQAWWALEFPFVKRYSRRNFNKHPDSVGKDLDITKAYCEKLSKIPVSVVNVVEGTRFTSLKHSYQ